MSLHHDWNFGFSAGRTFRPTTKLLPEDGRGHNRSLVIQSLYAGGAQSHADLSRSTGLTRVTVAALVTDLIAEGLVAERSEGLGASAGEDSPTALLDLDRSAFQIIGVDLSGMSYLRGAVLDIDGAVLTRAQVELAGAEKADALALVVELVDTLVNQATAPVLGIGVGCPGIVDLDGVVLQAPNLGWEGEPLERVLAHAFGVPVVVANDANVAVLAEHGFGDTDGDTIFVKVGQGVGAGLLLNGSLVIGSSFAAGEIGHVVVGSGGGSRCSCGKTGCLTTWVGAAYLAPRLEAAEGDSDARTSLLDEAGRRLGLALAPIVGALNVVEVILSGPSYVSEHPLLQRVGETIRQRTTEAYHGDVVVRMTALGEDNVVRGAAVLVLSRALGVS